MSDKLIEAVAKALYEASTRHAVTWENATWRAEWCAKAVVALAAIEASGFAVVPKEPTEEMRKCEFHYAFKTPEDVPPKIDWRPDVVYKLMLAARAKVTP